MNINKNSNFDNELAEITAGLNGKIKFESIENQESRKKREKQRAEQQIDFAAALDRAEKKRQEIREQEANANNAKQESLDELLEELVKGYKLDDFNEWFKDLSEKITGTITDDDKEAIIETLKEQIEYLETKTNVRAIEKNYKLSKMYALLKKIQSPDKRTINEMRTGYPRVGGKTKKNKKLKRKSNKNKLKKNLKKKTKKVKKIKKTKSKK